MFASHSNAYKMGASTSKVSTLVLNAQGGKTRRIQDLICEQNAHEPGMRYNIIIQANIRLLAAQTGARLEDIHVDEEEDDSPNDDKIEGEVFSWFSGNGKPKVTVDALVGQMLQDPKAGGITTLVCCANRRRLVYLKEVLGKLESALARFRSPIKATIWIDEADAYTTYWRDIEFSSVLSSPFVEKATLVTATVNKLVKEFGAISVLPLAVGAPDVYFSLRDYEHCVVPETTKSCLDFIKEHTLANLERYFSPGVRVFLPSAVKRVCHYAVANFWLEHGGAVLILNGEKKEIWVPRAAGSKEVLVLPKFGDGPDAGLEVGRQIGALYKKHGLSAFPLAVTGNLCLGRGITFQNEEFLFDHMILAPGIFQNGALDVQTIAYQCVGRGLGNIRHLPNFQERAATGFKPTLLTSQAILDAVLEAETVAGTLGRRAHETGVTVVTKQDLAIVSGSREGLLLAKSQVPVAFAMPERLKDLYTKPQAIWEREVLAAVAEADPVLHADLTAVTEDGQMRYTLSHVNNYGIGAKKGSKTGWSIPNYNGKFKKVLQCATKNERAPVPDPGEGWDLRQNIWYAALSHDGGVAKFVVCRWLGAE